MRLSTVEVVTRALQLVKVHIGPIPKVQGG